MHDSRHMRERSSQWQAVTVGVSDRDPRTGVSVDGEWEVEEEWREEGEEGGRGEYYRKIAGFREIISSTGAVAKELKVFKNPIHYIQYCMLAKTVCVEFYYPPL